MAKLKRRKPRWMARLSRKMDPESKRVQGERYYRDLERIQDWCERNKLPFRGVMSDILQRWMRNNGFKNVTAPLDDTDRL